MAGAPQVASIAVALVATFARVLYADPAIESASDRLVELAGEIIARRSPLALPPKLKPPAAFIEHEEEGQRVGEVTPPVDERVWGDSCVRQVHGMKNATERISWVPGGVPSTRRRHPHKNTTETAPPRRATLVPHIDRTAGITPKSTPSAAMGTGAAPLRRTLLSVGWSRSLRVARRKGRMTPPFA
jgi:hypothetical protein